MYESYASRVTRRRKACFMRPSLVLGFPLANQAQHSFLLRKSQLLQLEFSARYRVANPVTWALCRPYFYMPTRSVHVPPTSHLIPDKGAPTGLLFYHCHLFHRLSQVQVLSVGSLCPAALIAVPAPQASSEMMATTQRNLVFAHVPSMRPIGDLEANGEVETTRLRPFEVHRWGVWDTIE
jgi:hypothetical protein